MDRHELERAGLAPGKTQTGGDPTVPLPDPERPKTPTSPVETPAPPEEEKKSS